MGRRNEERDRGGVEKEGYGRGYGGRIFIIKKMYIFTCLISEDEMFNDSFPHKKVYNGWVFEIESSHRTKGGEDFGFEQGEDE